MKNGELEKVLNNVLGYVKPGKREREDALKLFEKIKGFIKKKYGLDARLMGSVAKDTFLKNDRDLDVFVFFERSVKREELEKKGLEIGNAVFEKFGGRDVQIAYAEHPYVKGRIDGYEIEVVPAYRVKCAEELKSAVDRTPFHTEYVLNRLKSRDDVRLLKAFLKCLHAYGSDLKTSGFSGYLCELLIINYGSFPSLLMEAQKWKYQEIIDIEKHWDVKEYRMLRRKFKGQPLIVIDPVDKNRNVAAALSLEKLSLFIFAARKFSEKPSENFFKEPGTRVNKKQLVKRIGQQERYVFAIVFRRPQIIDDILYPQLRRFRDNLIRLLENNEFRVEDSWVFGDKECGAAFELLVEKLPDYRVVYGPRIFDPVLHQERFLEKHKVVWFKNGRMAAEEERKCRTVRELLNRYLEGDEKELRNRGVPKYIARSVCEEYSILSNERLKIIKSKEFWKGLTKFNIKLLGS